MDMKLGYELLPGRGLRQGNRWFLFSCATQGLGKIIEVLFWIRDTTRYFPIRSDVN